ncbi:MAG: protein-glutamate O-methyltransferase CheR [Deltaproteobacteria bacterium]|nr:protein-glutamate O-methyltransferase CheR [Deltaproteobacteria bacterium]
MSLSSAILAPEEFKLIRELILRYCGVVLGDEQRGFVERRLRDRLDVLGLSDFRSYYRYLRFDPAGAHEIEDAAESITTHETYFLREEYQLKAFRYEVLPALIEARSSIRRLALWSAGCSTGEEVYTLAMLLLEAGIPSGWDVRVFGSDLSRRVIAHARRGVYGATSFRACPERYRQQYFRSTPEGMEVSREVRALCHFGQLNLVDAARVALIGKLDVIFCRNVLIYLNDGARMSVVEQFHRRLSPGGYLFLGHSESLLSTTTAFEPVVLANDLVYRRAPEVGENHEIATPQALATRIGGSKWRSR